MRRQLIPLALAAIVCACSHDEELRRSELDEIVQRHEDEVAHFRQVQAEFRRATTVPQQLDLKPDGSVTVEQCDLRGGPGREEFWCKYTWLNTTGHGVDEARITLTLRDPSSGWEKSEVMELKRPLSFPFGPDSSYTTHILVPLRGVRLSALEWKLGAQAVVNEAAR
jgi:hypothetical protein